MLMIQVSYPILKGRGGGLISYMLICRAAYITWLPTESHWMTPPFSLTFTSFYSVPSEKCNKR
jgi:hypothetical protein